MESAPARTESPAAQAEGSASDSGAAPKNPNTDPSKDTAAEKSSSAPARQPAAGENPSPSLAAAPTSNEPFPPPDITPPFEESARAGDGKWTKLGSLTKGELAAGEPLLFTTLIHPHPRSKFHTLTLVAIDLSRVDVGLAAGTGDVEGDEGKKVQVGVVPPEFRERLLAVYNGGFKERHGRWGFSLGDVTLSAPKPEGCAFVRDSNGAFVMGPWDAVSARAARATFVRQTPPCLVSGGALHPDLVKKREKGWAGHAADRKTRRRSVLGLSRGGRILYYGVGIELEPSQLGQGMLSARADVAAQFDINDYWVRFFLMGRPASPKGAEETMSLRVTTSLVEHMEYLKREYIDTATERDFFYLYRRQ
jgi:hypothetical protein